MLKIQWKFIVVLLFFSLTPLLVVFMISRHGMKNLEQTLVDDTRNGMKTIVSRELEQAVESYSHVLMQEKKATEIGIYAACRDVERLLAGDSWSAIDVFFDRDYDNPDTAPSDYRPSEKYTRRLKDGRRIVLPASYEQMVVAAATGVDMNRHLDDVNRLSKLRDVFKDVYRYVGSELYRVYFTLESGVHFSYPGHGEFPGNFDPRKREWYLSALHEDGAAWTVPMVDASTGNMVFSASRKVYRPNGELAGVLGLDVLVKVVLKEHELSSQWSSNMRSFLTVMMKNMETGENELLILAEREKMMQRGPWEHNWLKFDNDEAMRKMIHSIEGGRSGFIETSYEGNESICAFSPMEDRMQFVVVVPMSVIEEAPKRAVQRVEELTHRQESLLLLTVLIVIIAVSIAAYKGAGSVTAPLAHAIEGWKRLVQGDFSVRLGVRFNDERDMMVEAFNELAPRLEEHLQLTRAMELAQEVQLNLLPDSNPRFSGLDVAGVSMYCEKTGGDYYDFVELAGNGKKRFLIAVGDVSGHGLSSALLMATARALIRIRATIPGGPARVVGDVNKMLARDTDRTAQFMTLFYSEFDPESRELTWVRAGHDPAILYDPAHDEFMDLKGPGLALGVDEHYVYEQRSITLGKGQVLLIGTDGVWEMHNAEGRMFGKENLKAVIRRNANAGAGDIIDAVKDALLEFKRSGRIEDDVTMAAVKVLE